MITRCAPVLISTVTAIPGDSVISSEPARVTYEDKDTLVIEPGEADLRENDKVVEVCRNRAGFTEGELVSLRKRLCDGSRKTLHINRLRTIPKDRYDPSAQAVQEFVCTNADDAEVNDELDHVIDVPWNWDGPDYDAHSYIAGSLECGGYSVWGVLSRGRRECVFLRNRRRLREG